MLCSIYKITNLITKKVYIGQTWTSIQKKFKQHIYLKNKRNKLSFALTKYGIENFTVETVCTYDNEQDAYQLKKALIIHYDSINNGYNASFGKSSTKHSVLSREKIGKGNKGKLLGIKKSNKIPEPTKFKQTPEHIAKRVAAIKQTKENRAESVNSVMKE